MTRRERLENKLAKREEWAGKAEARSNAAYQASHRATDGIPFGQPILVGHHSERRHRNAIDKASRAMDRCCEESNLAKHHESKAEGLERQLERTIFSDDENAIEAINAKVAKLEAEQAEMKEANAAIRKYAKAGKESQVAALVALGHSPSIAAQLVEPDYAGRIGFAGYRLTNNNANIRRLRERIKEIETRNARSAAAEAGGGIVIEGNEWVRVTFAEKPERDILDALRSAGFRWGSGSWIGERAKLPECVQAYKPADAFDAYLPATPATV